MLLSRRHFARRMFLASAGLAGLPGVLRAQQAPFFIRRPADRPQIIGGVMSGDVMGNSAVLWSRCDRPATMIVDFATTESFQNAQRVRGPAALENSDFTAKCLLNGLPPGQKMFYRIGFEDLTDSRVMSEPMTGTFRTPPAGKRDVLFAWSGDTAGQGFGIDVARGGMKTYETVRRMQPDFFVHSGDTIYADNPISPGMRLEDGTIWKNIVTEAKSKVAETLSEFRGNHFYNQLDENVRKFNADVPIYFQWDDHEVLNNWYPGEQLQADPRYTVKSVSLLAARARRAFFDCLPVRPHPVEQIYRNIPYGPSLELFILDMRTHRGPNSPNRQTQLDDSSAYLGRAQLEEMKRALAASTATWKVICADMPLGLMIRDGATDFENSSNGSGPALGRELEIASLLGFVREKNIRNLIWITADVHHCASLHYDPARAEFKDFDPFWEFISGPLHAGTYGQPELDNTFGPETRFLGVPKGMTTGRTPADGFQFFGTIKIDGNTEEMTVTHWNVAGQKLWDITLPPQKA